MKALIIVDLQNDFLPGGALPVPEGDTIIPLANRLQTHFQYVLASQDWHPAKHASFSMNHPGRSPGDVITIKGIKQKLWQPHCVQHTEGAKLAPNLQLTRINKIFHKGADVEIDSYSAFFDSDHVKPTGLAGYLKAKKVNQLYILGLATDYCVKHTALDARALGLKTYVIKDACRAVNLHPDDEAKAIEEMRNAGVKVINSSAVFEAPERPRRPKPKPIAK